MSAPATLGERLHAQLDELARLAEPARHARQPAKTRTPLGRRVRERRMERAMTQEQLAERAGTTQAVVQKIENGRAKWPLCLEDLARALGTTPAWLLRGIVSQPGLEDPEVCEVAVALNRMSARQRDGIRYAIALALQAQRATKAAALARASVL